MQLIHKNTSFFGLYISFACCLMFCISCTFELKPDASKTYLKKNNGVVIDVVGDLPQNEKKELKSNLSSQIDRALNKQPNKGKFLGLIKITKSIAPVYDTSKVSKSKNSIFNSLVENGYYLSTIKIDTSMSGEKVVVKFTVDPKKSFYVKTYDLEIQNNAILPFTKIINKEDSIIRVNKPFSTPKGNAEISRLVNTLKNNGFYKVNMQDFRIDIDTSNKFLRSTAIDFEELLKAAKEAKKFYEAPFLNAYLVQQPTGDPSIFKQYKIGNVYFFPNSNTSNKITRLDTLGNLIIARNSAIKIKNKVYEKHNYLFKDSLYSQDLFNKTLFSLNKTDLWQNIRYETIIDTLKSTLDFKLKMTPKQRELIELGLDASRNTSGQNTSVGIGGTGLWGFGLSASYLNRNVAKEDIKSNTKLSGLIEINGRKFEPQNYNIYLSQQFTIPKLPKPFYAITNFFSAHKKNPEDFTIANSLFNLNFGLNNRKDFVRNLTTELSYGIQAKLKKSSFTFNYKPINLQLYGNYSRSDSFDTYLDSNPSQKFVYLDGFGIGMQFGVTYFAKSKNNLHNLSLSFNFEESGYTWGLLLKDSLIKNAKELQYIKFDFTAIYKYITNREKNHSISLRTNFSFGRAFNKDNSTNTMPIYKKYMSGGPSSMRAWKLRQLGPGRFSSQNEAYIQVGGDIQMEFNAEYRHNTNLNLLGFKLGWCGFIDIGNTFNNNNGSEFLNSSLNSNTFIKSTAIAIGPGLRIDFNYILLRFDLGYKLKDPYRQTTNGFPTSLTNFGLKELKIDYQDPLVSQRTFQTNNYSLQIGINYPF